MPTRRSFLSTIATAAVGSPIFASSPVPGKVIVAGLIIPADADDRDAVVSGASLGSTEAQHTAALMGHVFRLEVASVRSADEAKIATAAMRRDGAMLVAGGMTAAISDAISASGIPFLEIRSDVESPHKGDGRYRLSPSPEQVATALQRVSSDARSTAGLHVVSWHPSLRKYGAGELNERFREATGRAMNSVAWAGWLAMKWAVEAALRKRDIAVLRVDGHKGVTLRFGADRVLDQPLYVARSTAGGEEIIYA